MGTADTVTKAYMRENAIFADAFNYLLSSCGGHVDPDSLRELDTTEIALPFGGESDDAVQKYRDILKSAVIKKDDRFAYVLLGIENQTDIHYAMPVRNIIYDALQYGRQVSEAAAKHRKETGGGYNRGEYLSGFYKNDRLTPVITLVVHFGADAWDGPTSLHDMMDIPEGVEAINMCEAIEKMMADSEEKGVAKGKAEGRAEGKMEGRLGAFSDLVKDGLLSIKEAAARLNMSEAEFEAAMKK